MTTLAIKRLVTLPQVLEPSALYIIQNADNVHADLYFTGNDSNIVRRSVTTQDISNQITQAISEGAVAHSGTADQLSNVRLIAATGDAQWQVDFDGSGDAVGSLLLSATGIAPGEYPVVKVDHKGRALEGRALKYSDIPFIPGDKITSDISVNTTGNATTATRLQTPRTINGVEFDGASDITIAISDSVERIALAEKGIPGGVATLDENGQVPLTQMPPRVESVKDYLSTLFFPEQGEESRLYVASDTGAIFRWNGIGYVVVSDPRIKVANIVMSLNGQKGDVTLDKTSLGLNNVNNTSDSDKPVSLAQQAALDGKSNTGHTHSVAEVTGLETRLNTFAPLAALDNYYTIASITVRFDDLDAKKANVIHAHSIADINGLQVSLDSKALAGHTHSKSELGIENVDNTSDFNKPISFATLTALNSKVDSSLLGVNNGVATLDATGKVPSAQLPSYVDDVVEGANLAAFPVTGETGKIYVALDTNKCYRWGGSSYTAITSGAVDSVAGKTGVVSLVKADVGLGNVDNTSDVNKPVSTAQNTAISNAQAAAIAASAPVTHVGSGDTAHAAVTTTVNGFMLASDKVKLDAISGTNTGDQTTITGNAGTATKLQTARTINGVSFDGSASITLAKSDIGLGNVDNTSDANKPVSTAQATAISNAQTAAIAASAPSSHVGAGGTAHTAVTQTAAGFMSAADKVKLDGITGTNSGDETAATIKSKLGITTLSGSNTGDQTDITGNAGTATKLQTARTINGVSFDGSANITISAVDTTARIASTEKGAVNGVATLDASGKVPSTQLPSYVDDVVEGANLAAFPVTGEAGKIYVALDTSKTYRWSGSVYVAIASGSVDSVAGKTGVVTLVKADVGLANVDNTSDVNKPISTATQTALNSKSDTAHNHDSSYLPIAGGSLTGLLKLQSYIEKSVTIDNVSGVVNIDCSLANTFILKLVGNITGITISNKPDGTGSLYSLNLILVQDTTGGRTWVVPGTFKFQGGVFKQLTSSPSKTDIATLVTINNGSTWLVNFADNY